MLSLNPKHSLLKNKTNPELSSRFVLFVYGAGGRTRTGTSLRTRDFKSLASTIPPHQHLEVPPGFEPGNEGFADLCLTTWLWYQIRNGSRNLLTPSLPLQFKNGAEDGVRTRDLCLGKATLYQLSHSRISK